MGPYSAFAAINSDGRMAIWGKLADSTTESPVSEFVDDVLYADGNEGAFGALTGCTVPPGCSTTVTIVVIHYYIYIYITIIEEIETDALRLVQNIGSTSYADAEALIITKMATVLPSDNYVIYSSDSFDHDVFIANYTKFVTMFHESIVLVQQLVSNSRVTPEESYVLYAKILTQTQSLGSDY
jgi:hypothetical protein